MPGRPAHGGRRLYTARTIATARVRTCTNAAGLGVLTVTPAWTRRVRKRKGHPHAGPLVDVYLKARVRWRDIYKCRNDKNPEWAINCMAPRSTVGGRT